MINIFLDESYSRTGDGNRFIIAATAIFENNWKTFHGLAQKARQQRKDRRIDEINGLLDIAKGLSIVSYADIPCNFLPTRERDSFADIKNASRTDNVWSWCISYTVAIAMAHLLKHETKFNEAQVFYHRKDLKDDHRSSLEKTIIEALPQIIEDSQKDLGYTNVPRITAFKQVPDVDSRQPASLYQNGVWISHHLCGTFRKYGAVIRNKRIVVHDISETVLKTVGRLNPRS